MTRVEQLWQEISSQSGSAAFSSRGSMKTIPSTCMRGSITRGSVF